MNRGLAGWLHILLTAFAATTFMVPRASGVASEVTLHRFSPFALGENPTGLTADAAGNFYGTAVNGGAFNLGVVYKISPNPQGGWTNTVIYNFRGQGFAQHPKGAPALDAAGNLYGTTYGDGASVWGSIFKLTPTSSGDWNESVLVNFDGSDGQLSGQLAVDDVGNVFGTTYDTGPEYGTVFELTSSSGHWSKTALYTFMGGNDGGAPGSIVLDRSGNLYGSASYGVAGAGVVFELAPSLSGTWTETVLHAFTGGIDGSGPGGLSLDEAGQLYGTTVAGGSDAGCNSSVGCGTVFTLIPDGSGHWTKTILYSFGSAQNWLQYPSPVTFDSAGHLYGTTYQGGDASCYQGCGTVFKLTPDGSGHWTESVLHSFRATNDGYSPAGGVVVSASGHIFGTTYLGGCAGALNGTIFELTPSHSNRWKERVFELPESDGADPVSGLVADASGNFYGTTLGGGPYDSGTVFKLTPLGRNGWQETVIFAFGPSTGSYPSGLVIDAAGNLYGTTASGGGGTHQRGSVFELSPVAGGWQETNLISFDSRGPVQPVGSLVFDKAGNLYGVSEFGGASGFGVVFELTRGSGGQWTANILHSFSGYPGDGANPTAGLVFDAAGNLFGTTQRGGAGGCVAGNRNHVGCGTVFKLSFVPGTGWQETALYSFVGAKYGDGANPMGSLILDGAGNLFGTTVGGGLSAHGCDLAGLPPGCGTVFELTPAADGSLSESVLYQFNKLVGDGYNPAAGLAISQLGNLYGTAAYGGTYGSGAIFKMVPTPGGSWSETLVYSFSNTTDGEFPFSQLIFDAAGHLYGTTSGSGNQTGSVFRGTVFEIIPNTEPTIGSH